MPLSWESAWVQAATAGGTPVLGTFPEHSTCDHPIPLLRGPPKNAKGTVPLQGLLLSLEITPGQGRMAWLPAAG